MMQGGAGGVSRRRGQAAFSKLTGATARNLGICLLATALVGMLAATIAILHHASNSPWQMTHTKQAPGTTNRNINNIIISDPPVEGTSLVDCTVVTTSSSLSNPDGANGILHITVRHDLSPLASAVFMELVKARHFDGVFIFRVLPHFVAQFGVRHEGLELIEVDKPSKEKDAVHDKTLNNNRGTLSFAGGNPATQQVFVNLGDNRRLDPESRPFATIDEFAMTTVLDNLYTGYKDGSGQVKTMKLGEEAMRKQFPFMSQIQTCQVIREMGEK